MRTIEQWLEKAKEDERCWADAAIRNYNPKFAEIQVVDTLSDALNRAFDWQDSPEEEAFWVKIHMDLVNEESFEATDTITELITRYENTKAKLNTLQPDTSLREPFRQAAFKVYKNSYTNEIEELAQQIAERIGFSDKYEALQKEFEACKETSEDIHGLYISEVEKNSESINIIAKLEKEIEFLKNRKLIGWVVQNKDGGYSNRKVATFIKEDDGWSARGGITWENITPDQAMIICDRLPKWYDEEPTPIYK